MSSMVKAALVIADAIETEGGNLALHIDLGCMTDAIAQALADAGLLAPDLPEPDDHGIFVPDGKGWLPCGPDGPSVWTAPDGRVMVQRLEPGDLTPAQARQLAYALLAAANHAEGESNEAK